MQDLILICILIILLFIFFYQHPYIEKLTVKDIEEKKSDSCSCDEVKSLNNLVSQYNLLDDKIGTNITKIIDNNKDLTTLKNSINTIRVSMAKNQAAIGKINGLLQQFEDATQPVTEQTST